MTRGNPWADLPDSPPYVIPADRRYVEEFNSRWERHPERIIHLELPPEPVLGLHDAPVMVLAAMPGWSPGDREYYQQPGVLERALEDARSPIGSPVRFLDDAVAETPGGVWWRKLLRGWWREGHEYGDLARQLLLVQFRGYHSQKWYPCRDVLPSQLYSFELVQQATGHGRVIVVLSPRAAWLQHVPELEEYDRLVRVKVPETASVGLGNLRDPGPEMVCRELGPTTRRR